MALTGFYTGAITGGSVSLGGTRATSTGAGGVMSNRPFSGKDYFEATITTLTGTPAVGVAASSWNHSTSLGTGNDTVGYLASGAVKINGTTIATIATWVQGNRIDTEIDAPNRLIWFRVNNGLWNNSAGADPAAGTGGIDWSSALIATPYMAVSWSTSGTQWDANFSGPFTDTPSTGYSSMDNVGYTAVNSVVNPTEILTGFLSPTPVIGASPFPDRNIRQYSPASTVTVVSGTTKENGSIVTGKKVEIYDRVSGELLGVTYSDGSGNWSLPAVGRPSVRVVGSDPTTYNSQVYDNVTPV